jgi:hypothetical protein
MLVSFFSRVSSAYGAACALLFAVALGVLPASAQVTVTDPVGMDDYITAFATSLGTALAVAVGAGLGFMLVWKIWKAIRRAIG